MMKYEIVDNLTNKYERFSDFHSLQTYCKMWCDRLNTENEEIGEEPLHTVVTLEDMRDVLDACGFTLIKL